jgi:hypothetical protein
VYSRPFSPSATRSSTPRRCDGTRTTGTQAQLVGPADPAPGRPFAVPVRAPSEQSEPATHVFIWGRLSPSGVSDSGI